MMKSPCLLLPGLSLSCIGLLLFVLQAAALADDTAPIPHGQKTPPGPALLPEEALARMTVPEGFSVELVASEPQLVNPVAMTFDERGRIWVTESLEYPRREPGPGRDRVKILTDTDGDGRVDDVQVFAEGLNIPSGIAVGAGGVWVANAPDILYLQDTDGDGRADRTEVVLTGFGRSDTHELPNSLTWGPDGWLYGLNGVFNPCHVEYRGQTYDFTCALFRIHPRTRDFELFAEGTSNPWGVAFDTEGSAFLSACVIDHLWHLTESGYYHRQGGPYPPFTWKIESIVKHRHQQAAYCGIHFFDSDAYPAQYREKLYMGNIHGNCINSDSLERDGATYFGKPEPDFLSANDAWFMPVAQKTGPDGCLYVLDWYDRYHCYQDANRDPEGIDRLKGRLYRVRYKDQPLKGSLDLASESDVQLIERLHSPNLFLRDVAQRLLWERNRPETLALLRKLTLDDVEGRKARMHALWALIGAGPLEPQFHAELLAHADPGFRAWGVRAAGNQRQVTPELTALVQSLATDPSSDVQVQVAIAARKLRGVQPLPLLMTVLSHCRNDKLIPHIVWQNMHPLLEDESDDLLDLLESSELANHDNMRQLMPRIVERIVGRKSGDAQPISRVLKLLWEGKRANPVLAGQCLAMLALKIQTREIADDRLATLRKTVEPLLQGALNGAADGPLYLDAALLAATWKDPTALAAVRRIYADRGQPDARRIQALDALVAAVDEQLLPAVGIAMSGEPAGSQEFRRRTLDSLGRFDAPAVADTVLELWPQLEPELKPQAVELLTGRASWSKQLLLAIADKRLPTEALNVNQVRKLLSSKDEELVKQVAATWGTLRTERNPAREEVMARMRTLFRREPGDAHAGQVVFKKVCGQCHKMYGQGQEVGPDITVNGRSSYEQLLSNVFDPSLVIGASYQARTVATTDGRILTGLLVEDSDQRVVLKIQGGKLETIARADVDEMEVSKLSMMPEDLEKQLKPEELSDLFAFLTLDRPPEDPAARQLPGARAAVPRETSDPAHFAEVVGDVLPGFTTDACGEGGLAIVAEQFGRQGVLRTHPLDRGKPCVLRGKFLLPEGKRTRLVLDVSHDRQGDWELVVLANGKKLHTSPVGPKTAGDGWAQVSVDLSRLAGQQVELQLQNVATGWSWEYGYWGRAELITE